ncbi:MAG: lipoprotein [Gammaproteobacteria bacterium]|nr:lipoprotein [Gammaproteobacteria bacterium]MCP5138061.1 lipoprotein [Gammaproteobacteria bacterium]
MRLMFPLFLILVALGLGACGQKGPLYLPDEVIKAHEADVIAAQAKAAAEAAANEPTESSADTSAKP